MDLIDKQAVLEIINSYGGCDATDPCDRHCDTMMGSLYADIESLETISLSGEEDQSMDSSKKKKWDIELSYGIGFTVTGVPAATKEEAIHKARNLIENGTTILPFDGSVDDRGLEFEQVTYVQEKLTI